MVSFDHRDEGTTNATWLAADAWGEAAQLSLDGVRLLVVVAAHPDDESLGAGGLMAMAHAAGIPVTVIVATLGEHSHPDSPTLSPTELAALRRVEVVRAIDELAPGSAVHLLGLRDGCLRENVEPLRRAVAAAIDEGEGVLIASPWRGDGHPDHTAAGDAAAAAAETSGATHLEYPIWGWHQSAPDSKEWPWARVRTLPLGQKEVARKITALELHRSQTEPLSDLPGDEAIVSPMFSEHFHRDFETFFVSEKEARPPGRSHTSLAQGYFDAFYEGRADPWGFETRWYERRKRALALAALPRRRYASALEVGCSIGVTTAELASRVDRLLAIDIAEAPLAVARERLADEPRVRFERRTLPQEWPGETFDLIVVSEVGYYLSLDGLEQLVRRIATGLRPGGAVIVCHWRHPVTDYPLRGDQVHDAFRRCDDLVRVGGYDDDDFLLDVFGLQGATSVAAEEGLV